MERNDFLDGWARLRGVYPRLPNLEDQSGKNGRIVADAWFEPVRKFRREVWLDAVEQCIAHERYTPVPAVLRGYCFESSRLMREREQIQREAVTGETECAWCGGGGWFFAQNDDELVCYECVCSASRDPEHGRYILDKAQADEAWEWHQDEHTWRPKRSWVTEDETDELAEELEKAFKAGNVSKFFYETLKSK